MRVDFFQELISADEEVIQIQVAFNPQMPEEEKLAALVATIVDLVSNYNRLNTLVDDGNQTVQK